MAENFEPMMQALDRPGVNPELRNRIMQTMMMAYKYTGRDNEATSNISKAEFKALNENRERNIRAYSGEGGVTDPLTILIRFVNSKKKFSPKIWAMTLMKYLTQH